MMNHEERITKTIKRDLKFNVKVGFMQFLAMHISLLKEL